MGRYPWHLLKTDRISILKFSVCNKETFRLKQSVYFSSNTVDSWPLADVGADKILIELALAQPSSAHFCNEMRCLLTDSPLTAAKEVVPPSQLHNTVKSRAKIGLSPTSLLWHTVWRCQAFNDYTESNGRMIDEWKFGGKKRGGSGLIDVLCRNLRKTRKMSG
jgi:hypothetical protein